MIDQLEEADSLVVQHAGTTHTAITIRLLLLPCGVHHVPLTAHSPHLTARAVIGCPSFARRHRIRISSSKRFVHGSLSLSLSHPAVVIDLMRLFVHILIAQTEQNLPIQHSLHITPTDTRGH